MGDAERDQVQSTLMGFAREMGANSVAIQALHDSLALQQAEYKQHQADDIVHHQRVFAALKELGERQLKTDAKIADVLSQAKGGWRVVLGLGSVFMAAGGIVGALITFYHTGRFPHV